MRAVMMVLTMALILWAGSLTGQTRPEGGASEVTPDPAVPADIPPGDFAPDGGEDPGEEAVPEQDAEEGALDLPRQDPDLGPEGEPTVIEVGVFVRQITEVNQQAENFGVVAFLELHWTDPKLAFDTKACGCDFKFMHTDQFIKLAQDSNTLWPEFVIANKQGRVFYDLEGVRVEPDGGIIASQSFSATLQAPDFDFTRYPFDEQSFYIRLVSFFSSEYFVFEPLAGFSRVGDQLGEEEWVITDVQTIVDKAFGDRSRFSLKLEAERHVTYYLFRIFVPLLLIITVSWAIFFLGDYGKRIDIASGNLLLFIAFNFVISAELPRLGYLTLLDVTLMSAFVGTGLILICNVFLRRLELAGRTDLAHDIDRFVLWFYPLVYVVGVAGVGALYFP